MGSCWAAFSKEDYIREKSSSGGMFFELAKKIIDEGGIVYGVAMNQDCRLAEYKRSSCISELFSLLGSKYIQPRIGKTFSHVKIDLDNGIKVLFSGTGCIINGLKKYLKHYYDNLICIDVICHGVPSPLLWEKYIYDIEKMNGKLIRQVDFRNKKSGWEKICISLIDEEGHQRIIRSQDDSFMQWFLNNLSLRPSCYACKAKTERLADISLGDFWGIDNVAPEMNDTKGTSLVIVRTELGEQIFNDIKSKLNIKEVSYQEAIIENSMEVKSAIRPDRREEFFSDFTTLSIPQLEQKYNYISRKQRLKKFLLRNSIIQNIVGRKKRG